MPGPKLRRLAENFDRILAEGGPDAIKQKLEGLPGRDKKIEFLRSFHSIGEKYGRDMLMDVHHPEFRDSIALDTRVKKVAEVLGLKFLNYEAGEGFFLSAARRAGVTGWELDRLLYNFNQEVLAALAQRDSASA